MCSKEYGIDMKYYKHEENKKIALKFTELSPQIVYISNESSKYYLVSFRNLK